MIAPVSMRRAVVALAVLVLAVGGSASAGEPTAATGSAESAESVDPMAGAPAVGECRHVSTAEYLSDSNSEDPTPCEQAHTARVIAVGTLPEGIDWKSDDHVVHRAVVDTCAPAWDRAVGRSMKVRARTAYSWAWYVPTTAQRVDGARWFRCDLTLMGGRSKLLELPTTRTPALTSSTPPRGVARCATKEVLRLSCSRPHTWRATGAFTMRGRGFPSTEELQRAGERKCPALTRGTLFRWSWAVESLWRGGDRAVVCFTRTTR